MSEWASTLNGILNTMRTIEDGLSVSLPQHTRKSMIDSRVFIQKECADHEILDDVLRVSMNMYVAFVMSALSMNQYVTGSRTVRDVMMTVSTEGLRPINNVMIKPELSTEDRLNKFFKVEMASKDIGDIIAGDYEIEGNTSDNHHEEDSDRVRKHSGYSVSTVEHATKVDIPTGRVIQMSLGAPNVKGPALTLTMFLKLSPTFIPASVAEAFVGVNFTPSIKQRYIQMTTGEISFWKDFILAHDLNKKRRKAMRQDKSNALYDMIKESDSKVTNAWLKYSLLYKDKANIANTILVFDKQTFVRACNTYGLKFSNYSSRQKFFDKTMSMMIAIIDTNYNTVEFAYHSLENIGTYTFNQMKGASKNDKYDLTDIMKAYGQGMAPKF